MHQIRFQLGLRPRPRWGAHSAPADPLTGFEGPTSKGRNGREGEEKEERRKEGKGEGCIMAFGGMDAPAYYTLSSIFVKSQYTLVS